MSTTVVSQMPSRAAAKKKTWRTVAYTALILGSIALADPIPMDAGHLVQGPGERVRRPYPDMAEALAVEQLRSGVLEAAVRAVYVQHLPHHGDIDARPDAVVARWLRSASRGCASPAETSLRHSARDDDAARAGHDDPGLQDLSDARVRTTRSCRWCCRRSAARRSSSSCCGSTT